MPSLKYENSPSKGSFYTQEKVEILTNKEQEQEQEQDAQHGNTQNPEQEQEQEAPDGNNNPNPEKNNKGVIKRYF